MITITIENHRGKRKILEFPEEVNLSLMEVLKASNYPIMATCGGIALCATCLVQVLEGGNKLPPPTDDELAMLDTLPNPPPNIRLSCQLRVNKAMDQSVFRIVIG